MNANQWKADANAGLEKAAIDVQALASGGIDRLKEYWDQLSPGTKQTMLNALIGGAVGGTAMGGMGFMTAPEGQGLSSAVSKGLMGALLGSVAGGAGTAGYNALTSGRVLPGEVEGGRSLGDKVSDSVVGSMVSNPFLTAGGTIGGISAVTGAHSIMTNAGSIEKLRAAVAKAGSRGARISEMLPHAAKITGGALGVAALPAGLAMGYLLDKYLKGDYK